MHIYEVRPRKDHRGVDLISDVLPFGRLWYHRVAAENRTTGLMQPRMQSDTRSITAVHMIL